MAPSPGILDAKNTKARLDAEEAVQVTTAELESCYVVAHHPQASWLRQVAGMMRLQRTRLGCAAGLRWLQHVVLSSRVPGKQLLVRMSQPIIYLMLKEACEAQKLHAHRALRILQHVLELLPSTAQQARLVVSVQTVKSSQLNLSIQEEESPEAEPMAAAQGLTKLLVGRAKISRGLSVEGIPCHTKRAQPEPTEHRT
ncbi:Hypothetical protein (Fragment) [Durusdinium trenchii]|uniref:Uncharacterized protein n=1 Tax=Durusdinium trenchii TaxID=1381693 RepID=A0ABP0LXB6_9DINO